MNDRDLEAKIRDDLRAVAARPVPEHLAQRVAATGEARPLPAPRPWRPRALGGLAVAAAAVVVLAIAVSVVPWRTGPAATATPPAPTGSPAASSVPASPSTSANGSPAPAAGDWTGLSWSNPALSAPYDSIADVVAWKGSFVAVGQHQITTGSGGSQAAAWVSTDAKAWTQTMLDVPPASDSTLRRLIAIGGRLVAIGSSGPITCTGPAGEGQTCKPAPVAVWISDDGRSWKREAAPADFAGGSVSAVASDGRAIVLVGDAGWGEPRILTSTDGMAWQRVALPADVFKEAHFRGLVAAPMGFVLTGQRGGSEPVCCVNSGVTAGSAAAWSSADGATWAQAAVTGTAEALHTGMGAVYAGRDGFVAAGSSHSSPGWRSTDGRSWSPAVNSTGSPIGPQISDGNRIIGTSYADGGGENWWTSTDGVAWQPLPSHGDALRAPVWDSTQGATADAAFLVPGGMIVIGQNGSERFPIWFAQALTGPQPAGPSPTPSQTSVDTISWTDATPTPEPSPSVAPVPPGTPACTAADLTATAGWQGATGSMVGGLTVTNTGSSACALDGPPRNIVLRDHSRTLSDVDYAAELSGDAGVTTTASPVLLAPGDQAEAFLAWSNECAASRQTVTGVLVTLPDGSGPLLAKPDGPSVSGTPRCDLPKQPSTLTAYAFTVVVPEVTPPEPQPVEVIISAPAPATRGSALHFQVALTNLGSAAVALDPCPSYTEHLIVDGRALKSEQQFLLNCAALGRSLPAGVSVAFDMQIDIPATLPAGAVELFWSLDPGGPLNSTTGFDRAPVTITGG
jgi:hypothetical protein